MRWKGRFTRARVAGRAVRALHGPGRAGSRCATTRPPPRGRAPAPARAPGPAPSLSDCAPEFHERNWDAQSDSRVRGGAGHGTSSRTSLPYRGLLRADVPCP
ncbi:hypothetical protein GCM10009592_14090 [Brachybacterium rhamnosum]